MEILPFHLSLLCVQFSEHRTPFDLTGGGRSNSIQLNSNRTCICMAKNSVCRMQSKASEHEKCIIHWRHNRRRPRLVGE